MTRERETPKVVIIERGASLGAFVWGGLLGAAAALLFAPRSGAETRRVLRAKGRDLLDAASERADELRDFVSQGYERGKARVEEKLDTAKRTIDDRREAARDAMDAGRAAMHSAREELERRLTEARATRARAGRAAVEDEEAEGE